MATCYMLYDICFIYICICMYVYIYIYIYHKSCIFMEHPMIINQKTGLFHLFSSWTPAGTRVIDSRLQLLWHRWLGDLSFSPNPLLWGIYWSTGILRKFKGNPSFWVNLLEIQHVGKSTMCCTSPGHRPRLWQFENSWHEPTKMGPYYVGTIINTSHLSMVWIPPATHVWRFGVSESRTPIWGWFGRFWRWNHSTGCH